MNLFDLILFFGGYKPLKNKKLLSQLKAMTAIQHRDYVEKKRMEIFNFHRKRNLFYSDLTKGLSINSWNEVPVITKLHFRNTDISTVSSGFHWYNLKKGSTSGSSGIPLQYFKNKEMHGLTWQSIKSKYKSIGLDLSDCQARFYGIPKTRIKYISERFKDFLMNRYRFVIFDLSDDAMRVFLNKFEKTKFKYLYGYTNSLLQFSKYLIRVNKVLKDVCPTISCCIVTSEQCSLEDKELLEKALGVRVYNEYGSSEVDVIAFTDTEGNWRISSELLLVEVLDDDNQPIPDGQVGRIIITHLHNKAMPIIRYEVGDLGSVKRDLNGKVDVLVQLSGRLNEFAILPSGKRVPGFTMYYFAKEMVSVINSINEYQIRQVAINEFLVYVVSNSELDMKDELTIKSIMEKYLESDLIIRIHRVASIDREKSGKFKHFYVLPESKQ